MSQDAPCEEPEQSAPKAPTITPERLQAYHDAVADQIAAYGKMFIVVRDFPQSERSPVLQYLAEWPILHAVERDIDALIPQMLGHPQHLAEQFAEIEAFLNDLVGRKTGKTVSWDTISAKSEHGFAQAVMKRTAGLWHICREAPLKGEEDAPKPVTPDPRCSPAHLFYKQILRNGCLPPPQRLSDGIEAELTASKAAIAALAGSAAKVASNEWLFVRTGDGYTIRAFGVEGHFRRSRGLDHLALLVANAGQEIDMMSIVADSQALDDAAARPRAMNLFTDTEGYIVAMDATGMRTGARMDHGGRTVKGRAGYQRICDREAVGDIRSAIEHLEARIEADRQAGRAAQVAELEDEKARIEKYLAKVKGCFGLTRDLDNPYNKLRPRIAGALNRAYKMLRGAEPAMLDLADHFSLSIASINSTTFCYNPKSCPAWVYSTHRQLSPTVGGFLAPPPGQK